MKTVLKKILKSNSESLADGLFADLNTVLPESVDRTMARSLIDQWSETYIRRLQDVLSEQMSSMERYIQQTAGKDSWIAANARPILMLSLPILYGVLSVAGGAVPSLAISPAILEQLGTLAMTATGFYFGGRTIEKMGRKKRGR